MSARHRIEIGPMPTAEEMAARRRRLLGPAKVVNIHQAPKQPIEQPAIVITYRDQSPKDAHVRAWEYWKAEMGSPCKAYIKRRCDEMGVAYLAVIGPSRIQKFVDARQLLMHEIKTIIKPEISYPELGRLFGDRDHTSALYSVRKVEAMKGQEQGAAWVERKAQCAKESHARKKARGE